MGLGLGEGSWERVQNRRSRWLEAGGQSGALRKDRLRKRQERPLLAPRREDLSSEKWEARGREEGN